MAKSVVWRLLPLPYCKVEAQRLPFESSLVIMDRIKQHLDVSDVLQLYGNTEGGKVLHTGNQLIIHCVLFGWVGRARFLSIQQTTHV